MCSVGLAAQSQCEQTLASSMDPAKQRHGSGFSLIYRPFITPLEFIVLSLSHEETNTSNYRGTRAGRKCHE